MAETKASVPNAGDRDAAWRDVLATTLRRRERAWTRIVSETERRALTERALAAMRLTGTKDTAIEALVRVLEEAEQDWCSQSISHWGIVLPVRAHG